MFKTRRNILMVISTAACAFAVQVTFPLIALAQSGANYYAHIASSSVLTDNPGYEEVQLRSDGNYEIPSLVGKQLKLIGTGPSGVDTVKIVSQDLAPRQTFSGPQKIEFHVTAQYLGVLMPPISAQIQLSLVDRTPPEMVLELDSDEPVQIDNAGRKYFVGPVSVKPHAYVFDAVSMPNGEERNDPYRLRVVEGQTELLRERSAAITQIGMHTIEASYEDASGNRVSTRESFEIRTRPYGSLVAHLASFDCSERAGIAEHVSGTITLSKPVGSSAEMYPASTRLLLVDSAGKYHHLTTSDGLQVSGEGCATEVKFDLDLPSADGFGCSSRIEVLGRGIENTGEVDFLAVLDPNVVDNDPPAQGAGCLALASNAPSCSFKQIAPSNLNEVKVASMIYTEPVLSFLGFTNNDTCPPTYGQIFTKAALTWVDNDTESHSVSYPWIGDPGFSERCHQVFEIALAASALSYPTDGHANQQANKATITIDPPECNRICTCKLDVDGGTSFTVKGDTEGQAGMTIGALQTVVAECGNSTAQKGFKVGPDAPTPQGGQIQIPGVGTMGIAYSIYADAVATESVPGSIMNCPPYPNCETEIYLATLSEGKSYTKSDYLPFIGAPFQSHASGAITQSNSWYNVTVDQMDCEDGRDRSVNGSRKDNQNSLRNPVSTGSENWFLTFD